MSVTTLDQRGHVLWSDSQQTEASFTWHYDSTDPYAITLTIKLDIDPHTSTAWTFDHTLLSKALRQEHCMAGEGDVKIMTSDDRLCVVLCRDGEVYLNMDLHAARCFSRRLRRELPANVEAFREVLDQEIVELLNRPAST